MTINMDKKGIITINSNGVNSCYSWRDNNENTRKTSFNKYAFIEYLKDCDISKKYLKELEEF